MATYLLVFFLFLCAIPKREEDGAGLDRKAGTNVRESKGGL